MPPGPSSYLLLGAGAICSMREKGTFRGSFQDITRKASEYPFAHLCVTIPAGNDEIRTILVKLFHRVLVPGKKEDPRDRWDAVAGKPGYDIVKPTVSCLAIEFIFDDFNCNNVLHFSQQWQGIAYGASRLASILPGDHCRFQADLVDFLRNNQDGSAGLHYEVARVDVS